jgi:hypothetical protein
MRRQLSSNTRHFGRSHLTLLVIPHITRILVVALSQATALRAKRSIVCWLHWSKCNPLLLPRVPSSRHSKVSALPTIPPDHIMHAASLTPSPGKYYELIDACSELDTRALGALSRADFQRALSSSSLGLQPSEVCLMPKSILAIFCTFPTSSAGGVLDANDQERKH